MTLSKEALKDLYATKKLSSKQISLKLNCSEGKVNYWLKKYRIPKRSLSDAMYVRQNPDGDPFTVRQPQTLEDAFLFGMGVGLYWGEGTKSNKHTIRIGNTDPKFIKKFIDFLICIYNIKEEKLSFALQIFSDIPKEKALQFWIDYLGYPKSQFQEVVVTPARSLGTYKNKTQYGVLTVHFYNKKLRDILCQTIEDID